MPKMKIANGWNIFDLRFWLEMYFVLHFQLFFFFSRSHSFIHSCCRRALGTPKHRLYASKSYNVLNETRQVERMPSSRCADDKLHDVILWTKWLNGWHSGGHGHWTCPKCAAEFQIELNNMLNSFRASKLAETQSDGIFESGEIHNLINFLHLRKSACVWHAVYVRMHQ